MMLAGLAAALIASACTNDDDDFADGRNTATVWLISPTPFSEDDGQVQLDLIADVFDWPYTTPFEHTFLTGPIEGTGWNRRGYNSPNGKGGITISNLDHIWLYASDSFADDQYCRSTCTALPFGEEEALERAKQVLIKLGLDLDDFVFRTVAADEGPLVDVLTIANLVVDGKTTDLKWTVSHRNEDGKVVEGSGHFVTVSELGDVPILTPEEALTLAGREATPEAVANAELTLETQFDRDTNQRILIPVYSVPVTDSLNVDVTIAATRRQDIPYPDNDT
jgi:hypothetical protein